MAEKHLYDSLRLKSVMLMFNMGTASPSALFSSNCYFLPHIVSFSVQKVNRANGKFKVKAWSFRLRRGCKPRSSVNIFCGRIDFPNKPSHQVEKTPLFPQIGRSPKYPRFKEYFKKADMIEDKYFENSSSDQGVSFLPSLHFCRAYCIT